MLLHYMLPILLLYFSILKYFFSIIITNSSFSSHMNSKATITIHFLPPTPTPDLRDCACEKSHTPFLFFAPAGLTALLLTQPVFLAEGQGAGGSQEDAGILKAASFMEQIKDKHRSFWDFDLNLNPFIFLK